MSELALKLLQNEQDPPSSGWQPDVRGLLDKVLKRREQSRLADKVTDIEAGEQLEVSDRLGEIARKLKEMWTDPDSRHIFQEDKDAWQRRAYSGNFQLSSFIFDGQSSSASWFATNGSLTRRSDWGNLDRVSGYIGGDEETNLAHLPSDHFQIDLREHSAGLDKPEMVAQITLAGRGLLPQEFSKYGVSAAMLTPDYVHAKLDQVHQLRFYGGTEASVSYKTGTRKVGRSAEGGVQDNPGEIQQIEFLICGCQPRFTGEQFSSHATSDWLKIALNENGEWESIQKTDEWGRNIQIAASTLPDGRVNLVMSVNDEEETLILSGLDSSLFLKRAEELVDNISQPIQ